MKAISCIAITLAVLVLTSCNFETRKERKAAKKEGFELKKDDNQKKVDVFVDGKLFTSLKWGEGVYKPVLYPICAASGTEVTRGFPLSPRAGERADHRHHVGNWMNYGNVNGNDFWGNGHTGQRSENGGEIVLDRVTNLKSKKDIAECTTHGRWLDANGQALLNEQTDYRFQADGNMRIIDRKITLTALDKRVNFNDTKEGMFAIRVARELELPSDGKITIVGANGEPEQLEEASNKGITGNYLSSEGITGSDVWGTRARWMLLHGDIRGEKISIAICDHPDNVNYPAYWHARGYGLFSVNPLGVTDFTEGAQELNLSLEPGESLAFNYRLVVATGTTLTKSELDAISDHFSGK